MTTAPHIYIESDIPEGQTLAAWRAAKAQPRRTLLRRLLAR